MRKLSAYGPSLIVLATAMVVLFAGPGVVQHLTYKQTQARMVQAANRLETGGILEEMDRALQDVAAFVEPSVVHITAQQSSDDRRGVSSLSSGSGWIWDDEGHVITNYHVVRDADRIEIQLHSGKLRDARMVGFDRSTDIAVLRVPPGHLYPAVLADSAPEQGSMVFAFGSPFDFRFSMSQGIVSGKGRSVDVLGPSGYENFIQVDAAINPGNSGGPLTDYRGHVVGMNTAIATGSRGASLLDEGQFAGIGLAIPLSMIEPVVSQIIDKGLVEKGFLGVNIARNTTPARLQSLGLNREGVILSSVEENGPADRAGVEPGDVVLAVDGEPVSNGSQLRSIVSSRLPGDTVALELWRPDGNGQGTERTAEVLLTRLPFRASGELPLDQSTDRIAEVGIAKMATASRNLADQYGVEYHEGVLIERVIPESMLALFVEPGTIVVDVMGYPVTDVTSFLERLRGYNLGRGARVGLVLPDGTAASTVLRIYP